MADAVARFAGFAADYDAARPTPPAGLITLISQWSGAAAPDVVDVGAGTGLSTMIWAGRARRVIAIEPGSDMRAVLRRKVAAAPAGTRFAVTAATAERTGLADRCADIVTASQAMHWFDASLALPELARLLRPGGVLASYDCDWPPCIDWQTGAAYAAFGDILWRLERERGVLPPHAGSEHRRAMAASGLFRNVTEVAVAGREEGDAQRLVNLALSQGGAVALLAAGLTEHDLGIAALREVAFRRLARPRTWWWTYRIRLGVK
jgi:SAM-dependent methyltransferase